MAKIHLIIPAAGKGSRAGSPLPKQFSSIGSKTIIEWIEFIFSNVSSISSISIAVNPKSNIILKILASGFLLKRQFINQVEIHAQKLY